MKYGNYRSQGKRFNIFRSPITLVVAAIVLVVLAKATWSIHQKVLVSATKLTQAQAELNKLQSRQQTLSAEVSRLSTDQGIEAELRTKYRAVKEGESVAVILDDSNAAAIATASTTEEVGWWHSLWSFFGI